MSHDDETNVDALQERSRRNYRDAAWPYALPARFARKRELLTTQSTMISSLESPINSWDLRLADQPSETPPGDLDC